LFLTNYVSSQIKFDDYFTTKSLRFDYTIAGNVDSVNIFFEQLKKEPFWGGSHKNLIDVFNYGDFRVSIYDQESGKLIYSRGYCSLFIEWLDTPEAKIMKRSFYETVIVPFPKASIELVIEKRNRKNIFIEYYRQSISPTSYQIVADAPVSVTTKKIFGASESEKALDIAVIAEGYTKNEIEKFRKDTERFIGYFFDVEPFKTYKAKINFWIIEAISEESGTDIPGDSIWKNTALNTHFYTFDSERYLTTRDIKTVRNYAAAVPYDQIYILVNTEKYGGGGIYNYYNLCSSDNQEANLVFTHEFGHAFACLADEYAYEDTPPEERYDLTIEPYQVNVSSLADFNSKWKDMVEKDTPIPTPTTAEYRNKIGAFEGAHYVKTKMYRPTYDCKMRSNNVNYFCPVCSKALIEMLNFYCE